MVRPAVRAPIRPQTAFDGASSEVASLDDINHMPFHGGEGMTASACDLDLCRDRDIT
jgi:hypothetical protein